MGLDDLRLLMFGGLLLCLVKLLDEGHRLAGETAVELSASAGGEQRQKLHGLHGEKRIEVHATERELLEGTALALHSGLRHGGKRFGCNGDDAR